MRNGRRLAWLLFWAYLFTWTALLVVPQPISLIKWLLFGSNLSNRLGGAARHDKLIHATGYFLLLLSFSIAACPETLNKVKRSLVFWLCWGAIHGALVEIVQQLGQKRQGDFWDWLADCAGLVIAAGLVYAWNWARPTQTSIAMTD